MTQPAEEWVPARQDAFHVEFIELSGVLGDPGQRELFAKTLGVPVVGLDVDRAPEEERFIGRASSSVNSVSSGAFVTFTPRQPPASTDGASF